MRPHVRHLDPESLEWTEIFNTGALRRTLNTDPADQSFTSMVSIPAGWVGPSGAHYHSSFEEAYIVEGSLTLDGQDYLEPGSYLYRPGFIVHGWEELSEHGSLIIIKRGGKSDIVGVGPRQHDHEYVYKHVEDGRPHILHLKTESLPWLWHGVDPHGYATKVLSEDSSTGGQTVLLHLPEGWNGSFSADTKQNLECVVISGSFILADGAVFSPGHYFYRPIESNDPPITESEEGCLAILWTEPAVDRTQ